MSGDITISTLIVVFPILYHLDVQDTDDVVHLTNIFRDSKYCGWESCPINLQSTKVVLQLFRTILHMYREEFHIDRIRWITRQGDRVIGGICSESVDSDPENDRLLNDFWVDIQSMGFIIVSLARIFNM